MKKLIAFFIENQLLVFLALLLVTVVGFLLGSRMNTSFFPAQDEKFIIVQATYPGASPEEIEEGITLKVEDNLKGVTGIDRVTSTSSENAALIKVELKTGANADLVLQDVKNAVDQISTFPEGMDQIVVFVQDIVNFTAKLALVGDVSLATLEQTADRVEDDLRTLPEISKVVVFGYPEKEIEVAVQENKLRAYNLTFQDIAQVISSQNIQSTGGIIRGEEETIIRSDHKVYEADGLLDVVVKTQPNGSKVRLRDVAELREDWAETLNKGFYNDQPAILITVNTLNEENILKAAKNIEDYVTAFNAQAGAVKMVLVKDGTVNLKDRIALLQENGIIGAIIVFILLALFLRIRLAFWVAVGIPVSFLGMFIVIYFTGVTINILSLFGMILVIGILVDDGIVVGENVYQHYERGATRLQAVVNGTVEVLPSIVSAVLTTCLAFAFFLFIDGQLGDFFGDVAIVVIAALLFSLIEVVMFLPAHLAHTKDLEEGNVPTNNFKDKVERGFLRFRDKAFKPVSDFTLQYKAFTFLVVVGLFVITVGALRGGVVQAVFFPNIEQNEISVSFELASGTSAEITTETMDYIVSRIKGLNQEYKNREDIGKELFEAIELTLGPLSNQGEAKVYLVESKDRPIRSFDISNDLRRAVGPIPKAEKLSFATTTPFGKPINISLSGSDYERLRAAIGELKSGLESTGKAKDLVTNDKADQPEVNVSLNDAGRALGFTERSLITQVRSGFFGYEAQRLQRGNDEIKVWVRYDIDDRRNIDQLRQMRVRTASGETVAVGDIADLSPVNGLLAINHRDGKREITIEGEVASLQVNTPQFISEIKDEILPPILAKYPGIDVSYEGQQRDTAKLQKSVGSVGPIILVLILAVLIITFRSYSQAFALLILMPFGLIGAVWGHYIHGQPLSLLSFLGIIALIGVLLNDGLVYINAFNDCLKNGMSFNEALADTSMSRFRPIVLTTLTTSAGLAPLILEKSFQAQFLIPMAISIAYGLLIGSFMLVVVLPITLTLMNKLKVFAIQFWTGVRPSQESVEQAVKRLHQEKVQL